MPKNKNKNKEEIPNMSEDSKEIIKIAMNELKKVVSTFNNSGIIDISQQLQRISESVKAVKDKDMSKEELEAFAEQLKKDLNNIKGD